MILAGRRLNDSMANYVAGQIVKLMASQKILAKGSRVLVLGLTFKENCPDLRNSKVADVVRELKNYGAEVDVFDPWIDRDEAEHEYGIRPDQAPARRHLRCRRAGRRPQAVPRHGHRQRPQGVQEEARRVRHQIRFPRRPGRWAAVTHSRKAMKILLTGAAGFIGFHTARKLLARGDEVVGLDNLNDYYDPT